MGRFKEAVVPVLDAMLRGGWDITNVSRSVSGEFQITGKHGDWYAELLTVDEGVTDHCVLAYRGETGVCDDVAELVDFIQLEEEKRASKWVEAMGPLTG